MLLTVTTPLSTVELVSIVYGKQTCFQRHLAFMTFFSQNIGVSLKTVSTVNSAQLQHKNTEYFSNYPNVPIIHWLKLVWINPLPLVVYRTIVQIKCRVPINRMPIKRSRLYCVWDFLSDISVHLSTRKIAHSHSFVPRNCPWHGDTLQTVTSSVAWPLVPQPRTRAHSAQVPLPRPPRGVSWSAVPSSKTNKAVMWNMFI